MENLLKHYLDPTPLLLTYISCNLSKLSLQGLSPLETRLLNNVQIKEGF